MKNILKALTCFGKIVSNVQEYFTSSSSKVKQTIRNRCIQNQSPALSHRVGNSLNDIDTDTSKLYGKPSELVKNRHQNKTKQ